MSGPNGSVSRAFVAGKTPKAFARRQARKAHNPNYRPGKLDGWQMNAVQRRKELDQLARLRRRNGTDMGPESGWIEVIANYLRVRNGQVSAKDVAAEAAWLGLPRFDAQLVDDAVSHIARAAWGRYRLYSPKLAGDKLRLTSEERRAAGIEKIEAIDESRADRRRRLDRERKQASRSGEGVDASAAKSVPSKAEHIANLSREFRRSPATIYRWLKVPGRIEEERSIAAGGGAPSPKDEKSGVRMSMLPTVVSGGQKNSHEIEECEISRRRSISPSEKSEHTKILTGAA
ncbi:MAG: hypothetical protein J0I48_15385 [Devosia sp.]|uniref:hypothetical protein n=1 Tax=Devosia sp. 66-22 TaxID=1895753 RepID=UPI00092C91F1|nr:hypothetical protein [Devosia sp. 66-22]MBN9347553.1 hypothetical protein [Devosia sp.]OJX50668.1 MAG: hypothetical protein BGO81_20685 [Devosia sp. 66-22]